MVPDGRAAKPAGHLLVMVEIIMHVVNHEVLPNATMPADLSQRIRELGSAWAALSLRPRLSHEIKRHWDALICQWAESDLPIAVRKSGAVRGESLIHRGGRKFILADNSPAQWAFSRAFAGHAYSLDDIRTLLERDEIPLAYASKCAERDQVHFKCTLSSADNVNKRGWKLCHIQDVGLRTKTRLEDLAVDTLIRHFCLFMLPSNHFVIPLEWSGLGELPEVIDEIRKYELLDRQAAAGS